MKDLQNLVTAFVSALNREPIDAAYNGVLATVSMMSAADADQLAEQVRVFADLIAAATRVVHSTAAVPA